MKIVHDLAALRTTCTAPTEPLTRWGTVTDSPWGEYVYIDRGRPILGVAHLDTVIRPRRFACAKAGRHDRLIVSPALDDRLGVYILLHVLPALGIDCDVLLTKDEELGQSTASGFEPSHPYQWIFSFDRRASSRDHCPTVVLYDYDDQCPREAIKRAGFKIETGSYSDIADLTNLGVIGFNFTAGYNNEHTRACYAFLSDINTSIAAFTKLHAELKTQTLPYTIPPARMYTRTTGGRCDWMGDDGDGGHFIYPTGTDDRWEDEDWRNPNPRRRRDRQDRLIPADSVMSARWEDDDPDEDADPLDFDCAICGSPVTDDDAYMLPDVGERIHVCDSCLDRMTAAPPHAETRGGHHKPKTPKSTGRRDPDRLRPRTRTRAS